MTSRFDLLVVAPDRRAPSMQYDGRSTIYTLPPQRDRRVVDMRKRELRAWETMLLIRRMY